MNAALRLANRFRLLFITAPRVALDHRLIAPLSLEGRTATGASGLGHVFSGLLRATADTLDELTSDQLRPVELALTEFLVASLAAEGSPAALGGAGAARAAHLHRICQTIETLLADPDLTLGQVANEDGISPRYLQKLFASAGQSFSTYLRTRRLERCRLDLTSPMCAGLSISEICFRWGFNGSAHFSRAFKDQYGVSPREYRRASLAGGRSCARPARQGRRSMTQRMQDLASQIVALQAELDREIEKRRKVLGWTVRRRMVEFEHGVTEEHRRLRTTSPASSPTLRLARC